LHIRDIPGSNVGPETYDILHFFGTLPQVPPKNKGTLTQIDKPSFLHLFFSNFNVFLGALHGPLIAHVMLASVHRELLDAFTCTVNLTRQAM
jgi:hypothetical protein